MPRQASETLLRLNDPTFLPFLESNPLKESGSSQERTCLPRHFRAGWTGRGRPRCGRPSTQPGGPQCEEPAPGPPRDVGTRQGHQATGPQAARVHGVSRFWDEVSTSPSPPSRDWLLAKSLRKGPCSPPPDQLTYDSPQRPLLRGFLTGGFSGAGTATGSVRAWLRAT